MHKNAFAIWLKIIKVAAMGLLFSCAPDDPSDQRLASDSANFQDSGKQDQNVQSEQPEEVDQEVLGLTQAQCTTDQHRKITVSPRGQLYINSSTVLNDVRAQSSKGGVWSFAYVMREIFELSADPGTDPTKLAREQQVVDRFISHFGPNPNLNGLVVADRPTARKAIFRNWGRKTGTDQK